MLDGEPAFSLKDSVAGAPAVLFAIAALTAAETASDGDEHGGYLLAAAS